MDKSIIPLIKLLNEKGFITNSCCSGLYKDHNKETDWGFERGYITFSSLSPDIKECLKELSIKCCLKFIDSYDIPCYHFQGGSKDCVLVEKISCSCRVQNFVPIVNLRHSNKDNTNITLDILSEEMSDVVINDRWKRLQKELENS